MISSMKIASLVVGTLAAVAGAQDLSAFPQCAQWCINSMQQANKSQELGCAANDAACACRNQNFLYGVRDCSAELCASFDTAGQAIGYANEYCRNQGVDLRTVTTGLPSQFTNTNLPTGAGTGTGAGTTTRTGAGAGGSQSAVTTSAIVSTATENGSTVVSTVGSTTISSGGAGASGSSATSTVPIVSTVTSDGTTFSTTVGSSTLTTQTSGTGGTTGGANGGTTGGSGGATTSSNPNYAPQMTAAPAGLLAAAGVAVFLL